jgi:putative membrane protein
MNSKKLLLLGVVAFSTVTSFLVAQSNNLSRSDRQFFEKAAHSGMKEVEVSQAALPNLTTPEAKSFAQMMVADHTAANEKLKALATKKGVVLPAPDLRLAAKWSKQDRDMDKDYWKEMVEDHKEAVKLFEKAMKSDDAEVAAFAAETLPKLQQHLTMAEARSPKME